MTKRKLLNEKNECQIRAKNTQKRCFFVICMIFALACVLFCGINVQNTSQKQVYANSGAQNVDESTYTISNLTKLRQCGDKLYLIDSTTNALIFGTADDIRAGSAKSITSRYEVGSEGNITGVHPFGALRDVTVLQNGSVFLIDGVAGGVHEYTTEGGFASVHNAFENGYLINDVISICSDYNDDVFVLQKSDGYKILKKNIDKKYFSVAFELPYATITALGATYDADAKIICSFEDEIIYIVGGGSILRVALNDTTPIATQFATYDSTCLDVAMDYLGYPYVVLDSDKIIRFGTSAVSLALSTKSCAFNCENGVITYIKDAKNFATFSSDFVNNLSRFQHEIDFSASENLSSASEIYKINVGVGANAYKYPFKIVKYGQLNLNTMVIKLKDVVAHPTYAYVLANINGAMTACYINKDSLTKCEDENTVSSDYYTFTANTKLFKYPTADIINEKTSIVLKRVPSGTKLEVQSGVCGYMDAQEREFYQVKFDEKIYYVMRALVTDDETVATSSLQLKANNAHLKGHTVAQVYDGINGGTVVGEIAVGAKFYVNAKTFDNTSDFTYVEYLDENNNYICGFVATSAISLDLVSPLFILAIFLIVIVGILVLILVLYLISRSSKGKKVATKTGD